MSKFLFYVDDNGTINCLYSETSVSFIPPGSYKIEVIEVKDYERGIEIYRADEGVQKCIEELREWW